MPQHEIVEALEEVHEALTETIKQVANEPSIGLYFVQQHVHKAVPALLVLKTEVLDMTADAELCAANAKDALNTIKTMKDCGPPLIHQMINTINSASSLMPTLHQSRGSTPQLFRTPTRPAGLMKLPSRSISDVGDMHTSTSRQMPPSENSKDKSSSDTVPRHQALSSSTGPGTASDIETVRRSEGTTVRVASGASGFHGILESDQQNKLDVHPKVFTSAGYEIQTDAERASDTYLKPVLRSAKLEAGTLGSPGNSGSESAMTHESKDEDMVGRYVSTESLKEIHNVSSDHNEHSMIGNAETVSHETVQLLPDERERQIADSKPPEKKGWFQLPSQVFLGFGRRIEVIRQENMAGETVLKEKETVTIEGLDLEANFKQFQAERAAKLEAWLSESNGNTILKYQE
eukprot:c19302_g1_i2 orf=573-1784(+)